VGRLFLAGQGTSTDDDSTAVIISQVSVIVANPNTAPADGGCEISSQAGIKGTSGDPVPSTF